MAAVPMTDPYTWLGFIRNEDGSFTRKPGAPPETTPISTYSGDSYLLVKDIPVNQSHNIWFRLFLPREAIESSSPTSPKLPFIIYFHGGGFVAYNAASTIWDSSYRSFTTKIPTAFATVEYRLAPEHRLPAAYDDGMEVLEWIKNSDDDWITKYVDLSNTFLSGASAGGNLAFQLGLRVASSSSVDDLNPLKIKGMILIQPFFGGKERTESEQRSVNDPRFPLIVADALWDLCLPIGVDRDHEYSNPIPKLKSEQFDQIKALGWKILVTGHYGDPLIDRQIELVNVFKEKGVSIVGKFLEGGYHGIEDFDPAKLEVLVQEVKVFVSQSLS